MSTSIPRLAQALNSLPSVTAGEAGRWAVLERRCGRWIRCWSPILQRLHGQGDNSMPAGVRVTDSASPLRTRRGAAAMPRAAARSFAAKFRR